MWKKGWWLVLLPVIFYGQLSAQDQYKFEKEVRLKEEKVPAKARSYVEQFPFTKKVKWYLEQNLEEQSIEAKVKYQKKKHSIEFDSLGNLQDIEVEVKWESVSSLVRDSICSILNKNYARWRVQKIQIQYTGHPERLLRCIQNQATEESVTLNYELIIKAKTAGEVKQYEVLFADTGRLRRSSEILLRNSDNIEY